MRSDFDRLYLSMTIANQRTEALRRLKPFP